jgi:hypothetical protein
MGKDTPATDPSSADNPADNSTTTTQTTATAQAAPAAASAIITPAASTTTPQIAMVLDEFCSRLSAKDKRVELIGGFHHSETVAGHKKDTAANYSQRYTAFINQPA